VLTLGKRHGHLGCNEMLSMNPTDTRLQQQDAALTWAL
jgi:hypothetical protein